MVIESCFHQPIEATVRVSLDASPPAAKGAIVFFERRSWRRCSGCMGARSPKASGATTASTVCARPRCFRCFRRTAEQPLYRIEKRPALARRQGAWAVIGQAGMVLKRGHELAQVLKLFENPKLRLID